jgi:hypothetical protein
MLKTFSSLRTLKVALAAALLSCCLFSTIPVVTADNTPMCELACCAGQAPHVAGSCMHGECQVDLSFKARPHLQRKASVQATEPLCGLSDLLRNASRSFTFALAKESTKSHAPPQAAANVDSVSTPCQADCGGCPTSITSSNRFRNASSFAHATYARPPNSVEFSSVRLNLIRQRRALHQQFAPRPPPVSFS